MPTAYHSIQRLCKQYNVNLSSLSAFVFRLELFPPSHEYCVGCHEISLTAILTRRQSHG